MIVADDFETGESVTIELADYTNDQLTQAVLAKEDGAAEELRRRITGKD